MAQTAKKIKNLSTEIFVDRPAVPAVPEFIKNHQFFKTPMAIKKIFPTIGLPNFQEICKIDKPLLDFKKDNAFVANILKSITNLLLAGRSSCLNTADQIQFMVTRTERETKRVKIKELYDLAKLIESFAAFTDVNKDFGVVERAVAIVDGRVSLKLAANINDAVTSKPIFKAGESIFKIYGKIKERISDVGGEMEALEQTEAFKTFSKENVPNKDFNIVFSSEGQEGAWDILTMSMRGIKSCQRWDGEYPNCLIGSVLSKYVGIMYLTSGVDVGGYGSKMIRRSVIRYVIDAMTRKPCILIDKMYPDLNYDIFDAFKKTIQVKTSYPVYYTPDIISRAKYFYIPEEKINKKLAARERTYQDTPVRSKIDLDAQFLNNHKIEYSKELEGFKLNLKLHLSRTFESIFNKNTYTDTETRDVIRIIGLGSSFYDFADQMVNEVTVRFKPDLTQITLNSSKKYYKKYLSEFLLKRNIIQKNSLPYIKELIARFSGLPPEQYASVIEYIFKCMSNFAKQEIRDLI